MKKILLFSLIFLVCFGCSKIKTDSSSLRPIFEIISEAESKCLTEIIYYIPLLLENESLKIKVELKTDELCYDFVNDPGNVREQINQLVEKYPDDWFEHINWSPLGVDPIIRMIYVDENLTEPRMEKVFNGTKIIKERVLTSG